MIELAMMVKERDLLAPKWQMFINSLQFAPLAHAQKIRMIR